MGLCALVLAVGAVLQATADEVTGVVMVPSGNALVPRLTIEGTVGSRHEIQYCIGLRQPHWLLLTNLVVAHSPYWLVDAGAVPGAPRFYRVTAPAPETAPESMVLVPAGGFTMGDALDGTGSALPLHTVYVSAFYMDRYEVTKALWDEVKTWNGGNGYTYESPGSGKAANHPVQTVNWRDCVKWCNARSEKEGRTPCYYNEAGLATLFKTGVDVPYVKWDANGYRLPTEAEWEKAARGGASGRRFPWSNGDTITHSLANYVVYQEHGSNYYPYDQSPTASYHPDYADMVWPYTSPVGCFAANGYGLHDMAGNVWEWCCDRQGPYPSSAQSDPHGSETGSYRVYRGGSWNSHAVRCRAAVRFYNVSAYNYCDLGFRCVLAAGQ